MDTLFSQTLGNVENGIIIKQAFSIFKNATWDNNNKLKSLICLLTIIPKIVLIFCMKYALQNTNGILSTINGILYSMIYQKEEYSSF